MFHFSGSTHTPTHTHTHTPHLLHGPGGRGEREETPHLFFLPIRSRGEGGKKALMIAKKKMNKSPNDDVRAHVDFAYFRGGHINQERCQRAGGRFFCIQERRQQSEKMKGGINSR